MPGVRSPTGFRGRPAQKRSSGPLELNRPPPRTAKGVTRRSRHISWRSSGPRGGARRRHDPSGSGGWKLLGPPRPTSGERLKCSGGRDETLACAPKALARAWSRLCSRCSSQYQASRLLPFGSPRTSSALWTLAGSQCAAVPRLQCVGVRDRRLPANGRIPNTVRVGLESSGRARLLRGHARGLATR
jgi:hypothetical protein